MRQTTEAFQPLMWWVITKNGSTLHKSHYNSTKDGEIKYLILHARERFIDKRAQKSYWLEKYIVHDRNYVECDFNENGVVGKLSHYDKFGGGCITCSITDQHGKSKIVKFYGDNLAFHKCINYMQSLSNAPSWDAFELQQKDIEIKRLRKEVQLLKLKVKSLEEASNSVQ